MAAILEIKMVVSHTIAVAELKRNVHFEPFGIANVRIATIFIPTTGVMGKCYSSMVATLKTKTATLKHHLKYATIVVLYRR